MDNAGDSTVLEIVSLDTDSSTYYRNNTVPNSFTYNLKFINNNVDSVYYHKWEGSPGVGGTIKLAGVRIP